MIREKYGHQALEPELEQFIKEIEVKSKEAPQETKKEEVIESNVQEEKATQGEEAKL